jgi:hypothetical protein
MYVTAASTSHKNPTYQVLATMQYACQHKLFTWVSTMQHGASSLHCKPCSSHKPTSTQLAGQGILLHAVLQ